MSLPSLKLYLAAPRGFCAGVDRAIKIVEMALEKWGEPVYVRHEIVHNRYVVDGLREKGAVFVEELSECPDDRPVIFSAHGVPKAVPEAAKARNMIFVDANHSYEWMKLLTNKIQLLSDGKILFHDYYHRSTGVKQAVEELIGPATKKIGSIGVYE